MYVYFILDSRSPRWSLVFKAIRKKALSCVEICVFDYVNIFQTIFKGKHMESAQLWVTWYIYWQNIKLWSETEAIFLQDLFLFIYSVLVSLSDCKWPHV